VSTSARYQLYHPKWYRRRVSVWWWLESRPYASFVLRELTSVFVAAFAVVTLGLVRAVAQGPEAYARFLARLATPGFLLLDLVALVFVTAHAISWFNLAPRAMVVRLGGKRLPDAVVAGSNYAAWLVLSAAVAFLWLRR
jgi:fumarate reductase subunit C